MANRDLFIVVFGRVIAAVVALLTIKSVTSYLSPDQYGYLSLMMMIQMLCGLFLINPIGQYINRHTHEWWNEGLLWPKFRLYRNYIFFTASVGAVLMAFVGQPPNGDASYWTGGALFIMVVSATWNATFIPALNMLGFRGFAVLFSIVSVVLSLLLSILLMQWFATAIAWFFGQSIGMAVGALGAGRVIRSKATIKVTINSQYTLISKKDFFAYCLPLAMGTGFMWVQLSGYRFVIDAYWGLAELGFMSVGLMLAAQVWAFFESLVMQFLYPYFFKKISNNNNIEEGKEALSDLLNIVGPLYLILAGITATAAPLFVFLLVDEKYSGVVMFVGMGAIIESCRALANVFGNAVQVTKQTYSLALPYAIGSLVVLAALFYSGNEGLSVIYMGYSLIAASISMLLVMILVMFQQVGFSLDKRRWFLGGGMMGIFYLNSLWFVGYDNLEMALLSLCGLGVVGALFAAALLWQSPALERLLLVKIKAE